MARPRKKVDPELVRRLAMIGCTTAEIAAVCACSPDTLERRFAAAIENGREVGKSSLRRMQWKAAEGGNTGMLIWLGKQLLGQREPIDVTNSDGSLSAGFAALIAREGGTDGKADPRPSTH